MSRAPVNELPAASINSALSPFGVIDFADNHCLSAAAAVPAQAVPGSVVGGPPAYLDAHGIRYVPSAGLESPAADAQDQLVPMSRCAEGPEPAAGGVSQHELNSRVDERIRRFMAAKAEDPRGLQSLREDLRATRLQAERDLDWEARRSRLEAVRASREELYDNYDRGQSARSAREDDAMREKIRAARERMLREDELERIGAPRTSRGELAELRRQMEEDVAASRQGLSASAAAARRLSQPAAARVGKARESLRRGTGIDF